MTYEEFTAGVDEYCELFYEKGLKKQANKLLFEFADNFKKNVSQTDKDEILCRFCRELVEEEKFPEFRKFRLSLPFQLSTCRKCAGKISFSGSTTSRTIKKTNTAPTRYLNARITTPSAIN